MPDLCSICNDDTYGFHTTEEHDEEWVANADPCIECGAGPHEPCRPDSKCAAEEKWLQIQTPWSWCRHCGDRGGEHNPWCITLQGGRPDD